MEKIQKRKVGVAGGFFNQMMGNNKTVPVVGEGATVLHYSDRSPYQVIEVSEDGNTAVLEAMDAVIDPVYLASLNGRDCIGHQNWIYKPTGRKSTITWRNNKWKFVGNTFKFTKAFRERAEGVKNFYSYTQVMTEEERGAVYADKYNPYPSAVVPGITRAAKSYTPVSIIFGRMEYYYDWSF